MSKPIFERFPLDGALYRVIWGGELLASLIDIKTARIRLWLVKIDESDVNDLKWVTRATGMPYAIALDEAAGSIPKIFAGSFWRDRTLQSGYKMPGDAVFPDYRLDSRNWEIVYAKDRIGAKATRIAPTEYPLAVEDAQGRKWSLDNAPLVRCFTETGVELLIPCYEIFRRFYGLSTELANAMLAGHWKRELGAIVDVENSRVSSDGKSFQVLPIVNMRDIGCVGVAFFLAMATARKRVAEIYVDIENARRSGIAEPWIRARPPWDHGALPLKFVGRQLQSGAVLVLWIYESSFPELPYEVIRVRHREVIPVESSDAPVRPPGVSLEDRMEALSTATIKPAADAKASGKAVHFGLEESWENLVKVKHISHAQTYVLFNIEKEGKPPPARAMKLTTGIRSDTGRLKSTSFSSDTQNEILSRFDALNRCFATLLKEKKILACNDYDFSATVEIGEQKYSALPSVIGNQFRPWTILNLEEPRPRLCCVKEITSKDGKLFYWFEIEALPTKGFKALLVQPRAPECKLTEESFDVILKAAVVDKGQWKEESLKTIQEQAKWLSIQHSFENDSVRGSLVLKKMKLLAKSCP